jgi:2-amino-4-hydroxy-6-hydroxymethyldihydropteridine diphosphokinase
MSAVVLGLGSNLGARRALLSAAIALLDGLSGCRVIACSSLYRTPPLGPPQPDYLNAAVRVTWDAGLPDLLAATQQIEAQLARQRAVRWGPRTLDIDILWWSGGEVHDGLLEVPHQGLAGRAFALAPLLDVAPTLRATWGPRLAALGGPPEVARPGWLTPVPTSGGALATPWLSDAGELAALLPALIGCISAPSVRATHTLPLEAPSALDDAALQRWLAQATRAAFLGGFVVTRAAITARDATCVRGVLVGKAGASPRRLEPLVVRIERRDAHEARALVAHSAPDDGADFAESFTM